MEESFKVYVTAYKEILTVTPSISSEDRKILAEGYAEAVSYLVRKNGAYFRETEGEIYTKQMTVKIINELKPDYALEYLLKLVLGCLEPNDAFNCNIMQNTLGKLKAEKHAKRIRYYAIASGIFSVEEADYIAREKSIFFVDRRHTGKYGQLTKLIFENCVPVRVDRDIYKWAVSYWSRNIRGANSSLSVPFWNSSA